MVVNYGVNIMEKIEVVNKLKQLSDELKHLELAEKEMLSAQKALSEAEEKPLKALEKYDSEHKSSYIIDRIGEEPQKPSKALILFF